VLLRQLEPFPASVVNGRYDVLAYNRTYQAVVGELDSLPAEERNVLWRMFTNGVCRSRMLDWDEAAPRIVASFRSAMAKHLGEPTWKQFLAKMLAASPEFTEIWERHEVASLPRMTKRLVAPEVGVLHLESTSLWVAESVGVRLVTYTPLDEETRGRLETLQAGIAVG
jgi:hypothetical protein